MSRSAYYAVNQASTLLDMAEKKISRLATLQKPSSGEADVNGGVAAAYRKADAKKGIAAAKSSLDAVGKLLGQLRRSLGPVADREIGTMEKVHKALGVRLATLAKKLA